MNKLRTILYAIYGIITLVLYGMFCSVLCIIPMRFSLRYRIFVQWPKMMFYGARWITGIRWKFIGEDNIPSEPIIFCSKHQSAYETFLFPWYSPNPASFVHKRSLNYIPFFGWCFARLNMIAIDRSRPTEAIRQLVEEGVQRLKEGRNPVVFPEGTRVSVGEKGKYQSGAARMAMASGAKIVPVALNAGLVWPRQAKEIKPGLVTFSFGPAISPEGKTHQQIMDEVETWIEAEQRRLNPECYSHEQA